MRALLAFLLITTAVAGCLDDRPMAAQDPEAEARSLYVDPVQFIDDGHDHGNCANLRAMCKSGERLSRWPLPTELLGAVLQRDVFHFRGGLLAT